MSHVLTGLDHLLACPEKYLKGQTVGLVVNHTSIAKDARHSIERFHRDKKFVLKKLFAPEHGLYGVDQDMIKIGEAVDPISGLAIQSLYGKDAPSLSPRPEILDGLDNLVFDIQDIGARYYTFIYTMANCMAVCREAGVHMVVCDRPNPINGTHVEGNLVGEFWKSFVGQYPIPNRHGMTAGELAHLFNKQFGIDCDLTVVPLEGWKREMWQDQTGALWVPPSPNMPTLTTATVYPGMCLVEGTKLSEGRGTSLPFEQIGAPFIDAHRLAKNLQQEKLAGVMFRAQYFKPVFHKWGNRTCGGIHLHVTDRNRFKPFLTGLAVIRAVARLYPEEFEWRTEPYEFVSDRPAIDLLYGNSDFRESLIKNEDLSWADIEDSWSGDLNAFKKMREGFLLY